MAKKVVLDPGHGVETPGKCSPDKSYYEHEFNLDMAYRMKAILERHGVAVTLTRYDEHEPVIHSDPAMMERFSLAERVKVANTVRPDLFVSIHSNAAGMGGWMNARGYGIYTSCAGDTAGRNIAAGKVLARIKKAGVRLWGDGLHHEMFYVLKNTIDPAMLIEHLFHDNKEDVALLKDGAYRAKLAEANCKGILDYLGIAWVDEPAPKETGCICPHCGGALKIEKG